MIDFPASTFTWRSHPWTADAHYRYKGGFVGRQGEVYCVRFNLESRCSIRSCSSETEIFLGAPCRSEYTIASDNLFQIPSDEWRMAFSRDCQLTIAREHSTAVEAVSATPLSEAFQDFSIDVRGFEESTCLLDVSEIVAATLAGDRLNATSTYSDAERDLEVTVEFPVNLININDEEEGQFQICTGPVLLPDLDTYDGQEVSRVFVAHVALSRFDRAEFVLRREIDASDAERQWLDQPRGRDRYELLDPSDPPQGYPPARPRPKVYNEIWDLETTNTVTRASPHR